MRYCHLGGMNRVLEKRQSDAVAYHQELARAWEQRYRKRAFQARLRVLRQCLEGLDIRGQEWLDAGCGSGTLTRFLAQAGARVLGVDAAEGMIAAARALGSNHAQTEGLRFKRIETIARIPLADQSLDGILCSSVLEYVADPCACLAEFARLIRPGGLLVVSVPNRRSLVRRAQVSTRRLGCVVGQQWFAFLNHSRHEYTNAGFRVLLKEHGFSAAKGLPFGSPIPVWLQRLEFGGSLLAFRAIRLGQFACAPSRVQGSN